MYILHAINSRLCWLGKETSTPIHVEKSFGATDRCNAGKMYTIMIWAESQTSASDLAPGVMLKCSLMVKAASDGRPA